MVITTRLLPDAFFGKSYSATLKVAGGQPPYKFSGFPPKGLTLDPNTGELSGIPTSDRHEASSFTVRDSQNNSETQDVSLQVRRTTILTSHFLPEATQGSPYRTELKAVGNNIPTQWSISGGLDIKSIGLTLNPQTGELSGTPTKPGEFLLSVGAVTTSVDQQYRNFTLTIKQE
ncbi:MAG: Ig domain-containing protein [Pyrinomonadaceae bacterium]